MTVRNERGFILPLSVLLVIFLGISGMSFLQLQQMEMLMTLNEVSNHSAFYLANAGIERARETFKIPDDLTWNDVLDGTYDGDGDGKPDYTTIDDPDKVSPDLCPDPVNKGCVIPTFQTHNGNPTYIGEGKDGSPVIFPDIPFSDIFDKGQYEVRAFNDENNLTDKNQILIVRAIGQVRGENKLIQVKIKATSGLDLFNCKGNPGDICPDDTNGKPTVDPTPGREPSSHPTLPTHTHPLNDSQNYYRNVGNFPNLTLRTFSGSLQSNSYYFINHDVVIQNEGTVNNVVIFCTKNLEIGTGNTLNNATMIGVTSVSFHGNGTIRASLPHPAIISGGNVTGGSGSAVIYGAVYAQGTININPIDVHGVMIGNRIEIQGSSIFTDDENPAYYELMPGFTYPDDLKGTANVAGSWQEIK